MKPRPSFPAKLSPSAAPAKSGLKKVEPATAPGPRAVRTATAPTRTVSMGLGLDSGAVRAQMVAKLAAQGVRDRLVLQAMGVVERHRFVETALAVQAYEDTSLPIGLGQTISKPNVVARMIELLREGAQGKLGRILEIGTGCGYQAAVLSHVATEVYSIERIRGLHEKAKKKPVALSTAQCASAVWRWHVGFCQGCALCRHHLGGGRGRCAASLARSIGRGWAPGRSDGDPSRPSSAGGHSQNPWWL